MKYLKLISGILLILLAIANMVFWWISGAESFITGRMVRIQVGVSGAGFALGCYLIYEGSKMKKQPIKRN